MLKPDYYLFKFLEAPNYYWINDYSTVISEYYKPKPDYYLLKFLIVYNPANYK